MPYTGVIRNQVVVLEGDIQLPEGTKVTVIPQPVDMARKTLSEQWRCFDEGAEKVYQHLLAEIGTTHDSVEILRELRVERACR